MDVLDKTQEMARFLEQKLAEDVVILGMEGVSLMADYFIIATGRNTRQTRALSEYLELENKKEGILPLRIEGQNSGEWILMDYGDIIVHLFTAQQREFYNLEKLWGDALRVPVQAATGTDRTGE